MSDDFFDHFDDKIEVDWDKISATKIESIFKKLSEQEADEIFKEMQAAIDINNKKKTIMQYSLTILKLAAKYGLKFV